MKKRLSNRDWILISSYIDGQLSTRDTRKIEKRLQKDDSIKIAYQEILQTRRIIRSLPKRKAPRNFKLTPAMLAEHKPTLPIAFPIMSFASAVSAAMFILVFLFQNMPMTSKSMDFAEAPAMEAVQESNEDAAPIILWAPTAPGEVSGKGGGQEESFLAEPEMIVRQVEEEMDIIAEEAPAEAEMEVMADQFEEEYEGDSQEKMMDEAFVPEEESPPQAKKVEVENNDTPAILEDGEDQILTESSEEEINPILGILPTESEGKTLPPETIESTPIRQNIVLGWRIILPAGLLLIALSTGLGALIIWKKHRR
ncbi:MAG: hypothetical protein JEZ06_06525 [Anaerolineaceae bacterium]|nr:hypothetical protein [Anaerolineaceae bacterium]